MRTRSFLTLLALFNLVIFTRSSTSWAQALDQTTTFNLVNAQQNYLMQQQAAQMQAFQDAQIKAQQDALKQQQMNAMIPALTGICTAMFSSAQASTAGGTTTKDLDDTGYNLRQIAWADYESKGYTYDPEIDEQTSRDVGAEGTITFSAGCDKFMNREGKLGPWGNAALGQIRSHPESFGSNVPDDITKWCPKYPSMNKAQRELYWVWILMSMASSESSCNPAANNPNAPNGVARGLFQVWKPVCPRARNLGNPFENTECAIDLLAKELSNRDNLMTPTSRGREGTYWGPLRSDDWNKRRGGDISGAQKTRAIMARYKYCK